MGRFAGVAQKRPFENPYDNLIAHVLLRAVDDVKGRRMALCGTTGSTWQNEQRAEAMADARAWLSESPLADWMLDWVGQLVGFVEIDGQRLVEELIDEIEEDLSVCKT